MLIDETVKIPVDAGGETVTFEVDRPSGAQLRSFLDARFKTKGKRIKTDLAGARVAFLSRILINAEGLQFRDAEGKVRDLNKDTALTDSDKDKWARVLGEKTISSWKQLIPVNMLSSAAQHFEDSGPEESGDDLDWGEDQGN